MKVLDERLWFVFLGFLSFMPYLNFHLYPRFVFEFVSQVCILEWGGRSHDWRIMTTPRCKDQNHLYLLSLRSPKIFLHILLFHRHSEFFHDCPMFGWSAARFSRLANHFIVTYNFVIVIPLSVVLQPQPACSDQTGWQSTSTLSTTSGCPTSLYTTSRSSRLIATSYLF